VKAKDVPPFHVALTDLADYFPVFYDAFESGTDHAKGYFEGLNSRHDPWLHAHLMRHWVKLFLKGRDVVAEDYHPENLAMSGLQLCIKRWFIRMRKSEHGEIPFPGSRTLHNYYRQLTLPGEFKDMHNLLLLWHASAIGDFKGLSLIYPLSADVMKWRVDIPHPAKAIDEATTYQPDFDELGDLDIEPLTEDDEDRQAEGL
jgi:hypothetical protein